MYARSLPLNNEPDRHTAHLWRNILATEGIPTGAYGANLYIHATNLRMTACEKCYTNYKLIWRWIRFLGFFVHKRAAAGWGWYISMRFKFANTICKEIVSIALIRAVAEWIKQMFCWVYENVVVKKIRWNHYFGLDLRPTTIERDHPAPPMRFKMALWEYTDTQYYRKFCDVFQMCRQAATATCLPWHCVLSVVTFYWLNSYAQQAGHKTAGSVQPDENGEFSCSSKTCLWKLFAINCLLLAMPRTHYPIYATARQMANAPASAISKFIKNKQRRQIGEEKRLNRRTVAAKCHQFIIMRRKNVVGVVALQNIKIYLCNLLGARWIIIIL